MTKTIQLASGRIIPLSDIKGRECKHVFYTEANDGSRNDCVLIKERLHLVNGEIVPHCYIKENYKRNIYITKPGFRNHRDKKEFEDIDKLQRYSTTQIDMGRTICKALGEGNPNLPIRQVLRNPYVYGCDATTPVLIKHWYEEKWPGFVTRNVIATLDIETDVVTGDGTRMTLISVSCGEHKTVFGVRKYFGTIQNIKQKFHEKVEEYIGDYIRKWNATVEFELFDDAIQCIKKAFDLLHTWKPDFVVIWNMNFDLPKIINEINLAGWDMAHLFTDPCVPAKYRNARYRPGKSQKVTATGKVMALHPAEQWHNMECMSSFFFVDAMCVYKRVRVVGGNEPSYALDAILQKELGVRKLKFTMADHLYGLQWHQFMQKNYPIEYAVYNLFDTISLEELDSVTNDIGQTISLLTGHSEYSRFPSTPRRLSDDMEFFALEHGKVFGTTSDVMGEDPLDKYVLGMNDWIVTLPSHLVVNNGLRCIKGQPTHATLFRAHVADLDVEGAYPTTEDVMNISKETTYRELSKMEGISETTQRRNGINLTGGATNAVQFCNEIYGLPAFSELLEIYQNQKHTA